VGTERHSLFDYRLALVAGMLHSSDVSRGSACAARCETRHTCSSTDLLHFTLFAVNLNQDGSEARA